MENMIFPFASPKYVVGRGSLKFATSLSKKRIAIIRGGRSYNDEIKRTIEEGAKNSGAEISYIGEIRNEPFIEDIFKLVGKVKEFQPDLILAIGGGSVLDTAKAVHLFYENEDMTFEDSLIPYSLPPLGKKAIHISVPTTSGTGSEATSAAVFIDPDTLVKKMMLDNGIIPHYAILDADTTDSLTTKILVTTAMDALTHSIESVVSKNSTALSKFYAKESATTIFENLEKGIIKGEVITEENKIAREMILIASSMAGVAITNSCTGISHSYDHPGPRFGIAHGLVCGLMLPYSMKLIGKKAEYTSLANRLGIFGSDEECVEKLINSLFALMDRVGMKKTFSDYDIDEKEYFESAKTWSESSLNAFATMVSPAEMTFEKGMKFFEMCYNGM